MSYDNVSLKEQKNITQFKASVTGFGDLLDVGQVFKAFGSNKFAQISHSIW